jgi:outer membrane lipoprotein carrier protein
VLHAGGQVNKVVSILVVFVVTALQVTTAHAAELAEVITGVEGKYKSVAVMQADFVQTTRSALFGEEIQRGDVTLKRPSMMLWNFTNEKQFVTDGSTMWIYTKADNQVIRYDDISGATSTADSLLQSLDRLSELFEVALASETETTYVLGLTPKEENSQYKGIKLTLNHEHVVQSVVIDDAFDNVTELNFADIRLDGDVPDSKFKFDIPEGAEVITAGSM